MIFKSGGSRGDLNGFLDAGCQVDGKLHFEDTFRVDGKITGGVSSSGDLVVGEGGEVDGEVEVGRLFVTGTLRGSARARRIEVTPGGRLLADIETPTLVIEDGGTFEGHCSMPRPAEAKAESGSLRALPRQEVVPQEG
ncbi:MAG: polymer-forming cytoskeletal protein [Thermoanaerobaculia bacterium]|nr:polymer-forming cytoskeletal protein [Thermoanaerobaculia bacterium]